MGNLQTMARYTPQELAAMAQAELILPASLELEGSVNHLAIDSRSRRLGSRSMFVALSGAQRDGHDYIPDAYHAGARVFLVSRPQMLPGPACWIVVPDVLEALQRIAAVHRRKFRYPVIAITGSYGKTIVKEWLAELLGTSLNVVRSPRSYNSQIGVALAVWEMEAENEVAILEAGISEPGEMERLQEIIAPDIGIFTNLGAAHDSGFRDRSQKLEEKLKLFAGVQAVICCRDHDMVFPLISEQHAEVVTWGHHTDAKLQLVPGGQEFRFNWGRHQYEFRLPWSDNFARENFAAALTAALHLGLEPGDLSKAVESLSLPDLRMRVDPGLDGSWIVNDAYTSDLDSLKLAVEYAASWPRGKSRTAILSDIDQSNLKAGELYGAAGDLLVNSHFERLIAVGPEISAAEFPSAIEVLRFDSTESLLQEISGLSFRDEVVLLKGARRFRLERVAERLVEKNHGTRLEVDLDAIASNFRTFRRKIGPGVKIAVMVKALGYGSGDAEIARVLSYHRADYLGVAYADEGVELRRAGIRTPILVMNAKNQEFGRLKRHDLEPEIIDLEGWKRAAEFGLKIHVKLDTGMHRLGFDSAGLAELQEHIEAGSPLPQIGSMFTHLASGDDPAEDEFSRGQLQRFNQMADQLQHSLEQVSPDLPPPMRHALNTAGILRFPDSRMDMVRLGIGLYGYDPTGQLLLRPASRLMTNVTQVRTIKAGETVGYGRAGVAHTDMRIATIDIGYADGLRRSLGNGAGKVIVRDQEAPFFGNICMDMAIVDVSGIEGLRAGDPVEIFGDRISLENFANWLGTIPYEVLTSVSGRVKRVYFRG